MAEPPPPKKPVPGRPIYTQDYVDSLIFDYEKKIDFFKKVCEEERTKRLVAEAKLGRLAGRR